MAIAQNLGTFLSAMLPAVFAYVAPPGSDHIAMKVGSIVFAVTLVSAAAAWSARETRWTTP
jgi:hypothetical protein